MKIPEHLPEQLKLALSIMSGRITQEKLGESDWELLNAESNLDARLVAEQIVWEILIAGLPQDQSVIDNWKITADLLRRIAENGGIIIRKDLGVSDELVAQLEQEGVVRRTINGLIWGPRARMALDKIEQEK